MESHRETYYLGCDSDGWDDEDYDENSDEDSAEDCDGECRMLPSCSVMPMSAPSDNGLAEFLLDMDKPFAEKLFAFIDERGMTDVECYKRANVDKKTFSKIKCNDEYKPSKKTAVSFALALHLNMAETTHLLKSAGLALSKNSTFDLIIEYFIKTGRYETIDDVNEALYEFDQPTLGV